MRLIPSPVCGGGLGRGWPATVFKNNPAKTQKLKDNFTKPGAIHRLFVRLGIRFGAVYGSVSRGIRCPMGR
jgi:hypothetical protein